MEPPWTYSKKLHNIISYAPQAVSIYHLHAQKIRRFFEAKVLNNVWMIKILQCFTFRFEGLNKDGLSGVSLVTSSLRDLHLFHGDHLASCGVQRQVDTAICSFTYQLAPYPFENR